MGGSSSKTVQTKYEVRHTVQGQVVSTDISKKGSIKKKNKNSVSIKKKNKNSVRIKETSGYCKSTCANSQLAPGTHLTVIEEVSDTVAQATLSSCPVYRKKSSCPSCEVTDVLLGKNRSRSGSEKSLRFSDFNKVLRKPKIYDWEMEPLDIQLEDVEEPRPDDICYICEVYTGNLVRACRVCCRAYHDSCLSKIGHAPSPGHLMADQGWTCHQCVSLNYLLTQEEVTNVLNVLEDLEVSKENITEGNYVKYCRHRLHQENTRWTAWYETQMLKRFRSVGQVKTGIISFTQFLNIETVQLLGRRSKDSLVHLLTKAELAEAKKIFQKLDKVKTGITSKSAVNISAFVQQWFSGGNQLEDSIRYIDEDIDSSITWPEFLKHIALDLISLRGHAGQSESAAYFPDDTENGAFNCSSCDSVAVDEDRYSTCNSEPEPGVALIDTAMSVSQHRYLETSLSASESLDHGRPSMLDDINAHIEGTHRNHDKYTRQTESAASNCPQQEASNVASRIDHQVTAGTTTKQLPSHLPPKAPHGSLQASRQWAVSEHKTSPELAAFAPDNDNHHKLIPCKVVEHNSRRTGGNSSNTTAAYRMSEVIPRQAVASRGQSRALSQADCRFMPTPTCGNLRETHNNREC